MFSANDGLLLSVFYSESSVRGLSMKFRGLVGWCVLLATLAISAVAQPDNEAQFQGLKWRGIGPYRGGRVFGVDRVPRRPLTYLFRRVPAHAFPPPPLALCSPPHSPP